MSKKKKPGKTKLHSPGQVQQNALKLLKTACDQLVGEGHFKKFTEICQLKMVCNRVPTLKLKSHPQSGISNENLKMYNEIFAGQLQNTTLDTITGNQISLYSFLREGILLVNYVDVMEENLFHYTELQKIFEPYNRQGKRLTEFVNELVQLLYRMSLLCSNFLTSMFCYKVDGVAAYSGDGLTNEVILQMVKAPRYKIPIKEISREVIQLCWSDYNGDLMLLKEKPSKYGLKTQDDQELKVCIQKHALDRLEDRIGVVTGMMHFSVYVSMKGNHTINHPQGSSSLVEYQIHGKKLGYLVCSVHDEKIIIRTFLFLTNDGTPEGKKLFELSKLELLDKQYLGIDTLEGFIKFEIAEDPVLKELFTQTGCESLLNLEDVKPFVSSKIIARDPAMLCHYLMGMNSKDVSVKTIKPQSANYQELTNS